METHDKVKNHDKISRICIDVYKRVDGKVTADAFFCGDTDKLCSSLEVLLCQFLKTGIPKEIFATIVMNAFERFVRTGGSDRLLSNQYIIQRDTFDMSIIDEDASEEDT